MRKNSNYLSEIMFRRKITYKKLSAKSGVSSSTLQRIATFRQSPTQEVMIKISKALYMRVQDLFNLNY